MSIYSVYLESNASTVVLMFAVLSDKSYMSYYLIYFSLSLREERSDVISLNICVNINFVMTALPESMPYKHLIAW